MPKMENGFTLHVHPNPLQQLPEIFLSSSQVITTANTNWKMVCHPQFKRLVIDLGTRLGHCDRTKAWIRILLYLENRNLINALGLC